jgi:hypothetical protein
MKRAFDDLLDELEDALGWIAPKLEGLEDFNRVNINDDTRLEVTAATQVYGRRVDALKTSIAALEALNADGYPEVETFEVSETILLDLIDQEASMAAALDQFNLNEARRAAP